MSDIITPKKNYITITPGEGVQSYSVKKDGNSVFKIDDKATNFKVKEFSCHDGSDVVKIDSDLIIKLQALRDIIGKPIVINSGYRTTEYNKRIKGAPRSQHIYGKAADIAISGVSPEEVAKQAEALGFLGIGLYDWGCHVDTRKTKSFWKTDKQIPVESFLDPIIKPTAAVPTLKRGDTSMMVERLQQDFKYLGYDIQIDGRFGTETENILIRFQREENIKDDGIYGYVSYGHMKERLDA